MVSRFPQSHDHYEECGLTRHVIAIWTSSFLYLTMSEPFHELPMPGPFNDMLNRYGAAQCLTRREVTTCKVTLTSYFPMPLCTHMYKYVCSCVCVSEGFGEEEVAEEEKRVRSEKKKKERRMKARRQITQWRRSSRSQRD
jgi:hypothetical protein